MRILVVEDEEKIAALIAKGLASEQHEVTVRHDGEAGLNAAISGEYDAIVLDLMLPKKDGLSMLSELRARHVKTPVVVLTARDSVEDRVRGLDCGADDYLVKPFAFAELSARIRSVTRRADTTQAAILTVADVTLDPVNRVARRGEDVLDLTTKEFVLLQYFMLNANQPLTRSMIAERLWEGEAFNYSNVIDVYINFLRKKLDQDREEKLIVTLRGVGYMMRDPDRPT